MKNELIKVLKQYGDQQANLKSQPLLEQLSEDLLQVIKKHHKGDAS